MFWFRPKYALRWQRVNQNDFGSLVPNLMSLSTVVELWGAWDRWADGRPDRNIASVEDSVFGPHCICMLKGKPVVQKLMACDPSVWRQLEAIQRLLAICRVWPWTLTNQKFLLCISSQGQDLYSHQKLNIYIYWFFSESDYRRRRDDDDNNAGRHSTTTRVTFAKNDSLDRLWVVGWRPFPSYIPRLSLLSRYSTSCLMFRAMSFDCCDVVSTAATTAEHLLITKLTVVQVWN